MSGFGTLSKRSLKDCVWDVGPATIGLSLRSLSSETSTYLLFCLSKQIYEFWETIETAC